MQVSEPAFALLDVGFELIAAVADPLMALVALGELGFDELRRGAAYDLSFEALLQLGVERLFAPHIARFEDRGADRQIALGVAQALGDRAGRLADLEPQIPKDIEQILDNLLGVRRLLVGQQEQQIDIGEGGQFTAAITADGDDRHLFTGGRVGERIDPFGHQVVEAPDQLIDQKALLPHRGGCGPIGFEAAADFAASPRQRRLQRRQQRAALERRPRRLGDRLRQLLGECPPVEDVALPQDGGHHHLKGAARRRR